MTVLGFANSKCFKECCLFQIPTRISKHQKKLRENMEKHLKRWITKVDGWFLRFHGLFEKNWVVSFDSSPAGELKSRCWTHGSQVETLHAAYEGPELASGGGGCGEGWGWGGTSSYYNQSLHFAGTCTITFGVPCFLCSLKPGKSCTKILLVLHHGSFILPPAQHHVSAEAATDDSWRLASVLIVIEEFLIPVIQASVSSTFSRDYIPQW